jgi:hypothetical protein
MAKAAANDQRLTAEILATLPEDSLYGVRGYE